MQPRLTIQASPAASSTTISSAVRPEGNDKRDRSQPRGPVARARASDRTPRLGAVDETLEHERTIPDSGQSARRDRQVVANEVEFRELGLLREIRLVRDA